MLGSGRGKNPIWVGCGDKDEAFGLEIDVLFFFEITLLGLALSSDDPELVLALFSRSSSLLLSFLPGQVLVMKVKLKQVIHTIVTLSYSILDSPPFSEVRYLGPVLMRMRTGREG
jgi:hypothetical protein